MPLKYACMFVLKKSRLLKVKGMWTDNTRNSKNKGGSNRSV